jgi:hypothetical protein
MQPDGAGWTHSTAIGPDTKLGLQVDAKFSEMFSAVVQAVSDHRWDETYRPYLNMASLKAQFTPWLSIRVGRLPFSAYLISDYKNVGYSTPWVRPPVEVYEFNPILHFDGGDVTFRTNVGSVAWTLQVSGGSDSARASHEESFDAKSMGAVSLSATYGSSTYRAYYLSFKSDLYYDALDQPGGAFDLLRTLPAAFGGNPALADQYQVRDKQITYLSLGWNYDPGSWFLMVEAARNAGDEDMIAHTTAGYVTGGIRYGAWTPYLSVAKKKIDTPTTNANPIIGAILASQNKAQSSVSLGLRWDFLSNMDLKLQVDRVKNDDLSYGELANTQPAFQTGQSYNLISATLDFVF